VDATSFEFRLAVPAGTRFHPAVHSLIVKAGTYAGCAPGASTALADAVVAMVAGLGQGTPTEVQCWRDGGTIEVAIAGDGPGEPVLSPPAGSVRVRCGPDGGRWVCRVVMDV